MKYDYSYLIKKTLIAKSHDPLSSHCSRALGVLGSRF